MLQKPFSSSILFAFSFVSGTCAQSSSSSSVSLASATPATHTVAVGNGGFRYVPNVTIANPGDVIVFEFYPLNHSVVRAEYAGWEGCGTGGCNPCVPYELYHPEQAKLEFFSGIYYTGTWDPDNPQTWNLTINDTQPIFFYCNSIPGSCHPNGMVGAINPNHTSDLDAQFQAAVSASFQLNPGDAWPAEGNPTPTSSTSSSTPANKTSKDTLSGGAIAGIVVGIIAFVSTAGALIFFVARSQTYGKVVRNSLMASSEAGDTYMSRRSYEKPPWRWSSPFGFGPSGGKFVGYDRETGAPEFVAEAPTENEVHEMPLPSAGPEILSPVELEALEIGEQTSRAQEESATSGKE